jgi:Uma2 family endonuclease
MDFGVKEYWMINPRLKTIEVYLLEEDEYKQAAIYKGSDCAASQIFDGLDICLEEVFSKEQD